MYSEGTSALKKEYYTYDEGLKAEKAVRRKDTQLRKKEAARRKLMKKKIVTVIALISSMAFLVLFRYASIAREFRALTEKRAELELVNAKVVEMQMKVEQNVDQRKIEQEAERLGMKQPDENQIKYISLGNTDNGEVLKTEKTNALSAFINRLSVILEYLY